MHELLTTTQMYQVDADTIKAGTPGLVLMQRAGAAVYEVVVQHYSLQKTLVLCGPGNNGGDGFVVAKLLADHGWDVTVALLGDRKKLKGDAAKAASNWSGLVVPCDASAVKGHTLIIDALFGVGLTRTIEPDVQAVMQAVIVQKIPVIAVDIPSGIDGNTGQVLGLAMSAVVTVTFTRKKLGHVLLPGKEYCGKIIVADIGMDEAAITNLGSKYHENVSELWLERFPFPKAGDHKYSHGHAVVSGGALECTGATKLAATSALRIGAGLVTVASPRDALAVYAKCLISVMAKPYTTDKEFEVLISDKRKNAVLIGPGNGVTSATRHHVFAALNAGKACVLDADAITVCAEDPKTLFAALANNPNVVMTPHEGEFKRLFKVQGARLEQALQAAKQSHAVVVLKGSDTVIAAPDGRAAINTNAPATLATAGSGDVLAGIITGLLAKGMVPFDAACAGVWIHGRAAQLVGLGMIAEDLPDLLPQVLQDLQELYES